MSLLGQGIGHATLESHTFHDVPGIPYPLPPLSKMPQHALIGYHPCIGY